MTFDFLCHSHYNAPHSYVRLDAFDGFSRILIISNPWIKQVGTDFIPTENERKNEKKSFAKTPYFFKTVCSECMVSYLDPVFLWCAALAFFYVGPSFISSTFLNFYDVVGAVGLLVNATTLYKYLALLLPLLIGFFFLAHISASVALPSMSSLDILRVVSVDLTISSLINT